MSYEYLSWGRVGASSSDIDYYPVSRQYNLNFASADKILVYGNGRSYGDVCLSDQASIINGRSLDKFIHFNRKDGTLTCETGITLQQILKLIVPTGWFLPVTPGTQYVTLGGAIANDVHGKNHHAVGSFGCFVEEFELCQSQNQRLVCSKTQNANYFFATIGGLGLTGWIVWAKIRLLPICNTNMVTNSYKFANLAEYFVLNAALAATSSYTVAWIDCLSSGNKLGRGIYFTGEHAGFQERIVLPKLRRLNVPLKPPVSLINRYSLQMFNFLYYHRKQSAAPTVQHYEPFFYPLDSINNWNKLYGKRGFYQYQFVVPFSGAQEVITEVLKHISKRKMGSFLAVLKTFGNISSGGLLSFARPGVTLALDFANQGNKTAQLFRILDQIVLEAGGAIYPAKDACMSPELFRHGYPRLEEFKLLKDPKFSSNFWRRVVGE
ncbi:MAG TPA: FAD-binding oxidoreductase [Aquella sp.]|nr:FAD-binding oxidoreductase [Aquella sp.]